MTPLTFERKSSASISSKNESYRGWYKALFWAAAFLGRPFGGIRPRRIVHFLAKKAYGDSKFDSAHFRVRRDRYGNKLWLHPHFWIDYQIIAFGVYDESLHQLLRNLVKPGAVCIDAGANIGSVTVRLMQLVGEKGRVYAFEPVPDVFQKLQANVALNAHNGASASLHQLALSRINGHAKLEIADDSYANQGMASLHGEGHPAVCQVVDVATMTLDDFVKQQNLTRLDLIKMDVQGAEAWIIDGGATTLARLKPNLVVEVSAPCLRAFGKSPSELLRSIEAIGYDCFLVSESGEITTLIHANDIEDDFDVADVYCQAKQNDLR
jgi:FkbM family methyltransferase